MMDVGSLPGRGHSSDADHACTQIYALYGYVQNLLSCWRHNTSAVVFAGEVAAGGFRCPAVVRRASRWRMPDFILIVSAGKDDEGGMSTAMSWFNGHQRPPPVSTGWKNHMNARKFLAPECRMVSRYQPAINPPNPRIYAVPKAPCTAPRKS